MTQLLTLPMIVPLSSAGILLPGAKLHTSVTGTSTPQPVYQDVGLTTPHENPVEANGAGVFPPIYLDGALPSYRLLLTDANDVTLPGYPIDNVPSNQNTGQQFRLKHTAPQLLFEETDASTNNKKWALRVSSEQLQIVLLNDAENSEAVVFTLDRTANSVDQLNFAGQFLQVDGNTVATQTQGQFTATLTGMTISTTGLVNWRRSGSKVALLVPSNIFGTSNTTAMTLTGLPGELAPFSSGGIVLCRVHDNGANVLGTAAIGPSAITFGVGAASGVFTGSGTKGLAAGTTIIYDTDELSIA